MKKSTERVSKSIRLSVLDRLYGSLNSGSFFSEGWGPDAQIAAFEALPGAVGEAPRIEVLWTHEARRPSATLRRGVFKSPMAAHGLPAESHRAPLLMVTPNDAMSSRRAVYIHLAATGDEGFQRRLRTFALPLARAGVASVILENPYYGERRPTQQNGVYLRHFTDLLMMGETAAREGWALVRWLRERGFTSIGVTGVSMGGHMAALVGAVTREEVAVVPCIGMHSAAPVFTEGILSQQIDWALLGESVGGRAAAVQKVRDILAYSDIRRYPLPVRPEATICVSATRDAYINNHSILLLQQHWSGSEVRWVRAGHVRAFVTHSKVFLKAMHEALRRLNP